VTSARATRIGPARARGAQRAPRAIADRPIARFARLNPIVRMA
jgi:hypothetical protein